MKKLDAYVDQICRGIAGPRALRAHIRQELREHLNEAVASHQESGMSEDEAVERALRDFGTPEEIRSGLEATHGHRLLAVLIDKALQWQEKTMKSRWLWMTWAHVALVAMILLEVAFIVGLIIFVVPKFIYFNERGFLASGNAADTSAFIERSVSFLRGVAISMMECLYWVIPLVILWIAFEWFVRRENKSLIRLAALGTVAVGLLLVVILCSIAMVIPLTIGLHDAYHRSAQTDVRRRLAEIDTSIGAMESAMRAPSPDRDVIWRHTLDADRVVADLVTDGASASAIVAMAQPGRTEAAQKELQALSDRIHELRETANSNPANLPVALGNYREAYRRVSPATLPAGPP